MQSLISLSIESLLVRAAKNFELNNCRTFESRSENVGIMIGVLACVWGQVGDFEGDK